MNKIIELEMGDGSKILIETSIVNNAAVLNEVGMDNNDEKVGKTFKKVMQNIRPIIEQVHAAFLGISLDEIEVEMGIGFSADLDIILASSNVNSNLVVRMKWKNDTHHE